MRLLVLPACLLVSAALLSGCAGERASLRGAGSAQQQDGTAAAPAADLADADEVARRFVAAVAARDCEELLSLLSAATLRHLDAPPEAGPTGRQDLCEGLTAGRARPMAIRTGAVAVPGGALVELESEGEVEPLLLVLEGCCWKIDLLGSGAE